MNGWGFTRSQLRLRAGTAAPAVNYAVAADGANNMYGGLVRNGSQLFCPYHRGPYIWNRGAAYGRTSEDDGVTWSEAEMIWNPEGGYDLLEIKAMVLADGTYLLSGSSEHSNSAGTLLHSYSFVIRGRPGDWEKPILVHGAPGSVYSSCSGAALEVVPGGKILLPIYYDAVDAGLYVDVNARAGVLSSIDGGLTWSGPVQVTPSTGTEALLMLNPDESIYFWTREGPRYTSIDAGLTWSVGVSASGMAQYQACQPAIARTAEGNLWRMYRKGPNSTNAQTWLAYSTDEGLTWINQAPLVGLMSGFTAAYYQYGTLLPWGSNGVEGIACIERGEIFVQNGIKASDISYFRL